MVLSCLLSVFPYQGLISTRTGIFVSCLFSLWHLESAWQVVGIQSIDVAWICLVLLAFAVDEPSSRIISQDQ